MTVYAVTFAAVAITAAQDLFEIVAPSNSRLKLRSVRVDQYTDFGDAASELIPVSIIRGHTTSGSGGTTATPVPVGVTTKAAAATAEVNNTTIAADGAPVTLFAGAWNIEDGFNWCPRHYDEQIGIEASQRLVVRCGAPADSLTVSGTLVFEDTGNI